jgi:membrane protease YdiL (CAAX protease family)
MTRTTISTHILALLVLLGLSVTTASAQDYPNPITGIDTIPEFLAKVLQGLSILLMPLVVIFIIYAGYLFVTAQGEESKIQKARTAILWTLIGAGVILGAQIMASILSDTLTQLNTP